MFSSIKSKLSGIKTYLVAAAAICSALVAWQQDQISTWNALQTILAAFGACTMRAAVAKAQDAATATTATVARILPPVVTGGGVGIAAVDVTEDRH